MTWPSDSCSSFVGIPIVELISASLGIWQERRPGLLALTIITVERQHQAYNTITSMIQFLLAAEKFPSCCVVFFPLTASSFFNHWHGPYTFYTR